MTIRIDRKSYHVWHPFTDMSLFFSKPIVFTRGEGIKLWDDEGHVYLNMMSSLLNNHCGQGRQEIIDAVTEQMSMLTYATIERVTHPMVIRLADKLVDITPSRLKKVFFTNSGSGAIETAIKIIRQYAKLKGNPDKYKIITLMNSYHGVSMGALSASGISTIQEPFEPLLPGFPHIPPAYCYRCVYGMHYPDCDLACALALEKTIVQEGPENIGAFLLEPVMGVSGVIIPPADYFVKIREVCRRYDVKLIFDEVITGFGRLGSMFAAEYWNVCPDIMALSKGINSGYLPLGATLVTDDIYNTFVDAGSKRGIFQHGDTTNGHPVCCASGVANIEIIERDKLVENARYVGEYFVGRIQKFYDYAMVGDIRGLGLLIAIELVEDKRNRRPLPSDQVFMIAVRLLKSGIFAYYYKNNLFIAPPLVCTKDEVDEAFEIYDKTLQKFHNIMN